MKRSLLLAFILLNVTPFYAENAPVFKFETEIVDYGDIARNSDGIKLLKFTNIGKSPIIITNVKGSCGCTVPTSPKEPIMPGEEGEIQKLEDSSIRKLENGLQIQKAFY